MNCGRRLVRTSCVACEALWRWAIEVGCGKALGAVHVHTTAVARLPAWRERCAARPLCAHRQGHVRLRAWASVFCAVAVMVVVRLRSWFWLGCDLLLDLP